MHRHQLTFTVVCVVALAGCLDGFLTTGERRPETPDEADPVVPGTTNNNGVVVSNNGVEPTDPTECLTLRPFFEREVWPKVAEQTCLNCHIANGLAAETRFVLESPARNPDHLEPNFQTFVTVAALPSPDDASTPLMLAKASGSIEHGGGAILPADGNAFDILSRFVASVGAPDECVEGTGTDVDPYEPGEFYEGLTFVDERKLLQRVSLSLVGRFPTDDEKAAVAANGVDGVAAAMDSMMTEDAFYARLEEVWNDILLTQGYDGVAERVLSYEHFPDRGWYQTWDYSNEPDPQQAEYDMADAYRMSIRREPLKFITHVVRNDRPFTEIVTGDYFVTSGMGARGYGVYDDVAPRLNDVWDPDEYVEARLPALVDRAGNVQPSQTGYYPHSGLLSMFHWLKRYPTTETNRNRHRARMLYQLFLGVDIMDLAPAVTDAAAATEQFVTPTLEAPECVVCHQVIDPVAGLFQDYNDLGEYGPRDDGWYTDMFGPGFEDEPIPAGELWRAPQWLGERIAADSRFATAMAEHAWYMMSGRKPLRAPKDVDDPLYDFHRRAYDAERAMIAQVAADFVAASYDFKEALKSVVKSDYYRVDGLESATADPRRLAELNELGIAHLMTNEQYFRKLQAIFGRSWGGLTGDWGILYGGIDSSSVTERNGEPSGAMGALQRMIANDMACANVAWDFAHPPAERYLFPDIELDVWPGSAPDAEARIRDTIVRLHERFLGRFDASDDPEVTRTYDLFAAVQADGQAKVADGTYPDQELYTCRGPEGSPYRISDDPNYTLRAWRAVITYLLRNYDFLYE